MNIILNDNVISKLQVNSEQMLLIFDLSLREIAVESGMGNPQIVVSGHKSKSLVVYSRLRSYSCLLFNCGR